ncbi:MAG: hypothetical protein JW828_01140 [Sedimentisphaerales bacterium]|nr:hypothetical protein [Sedimentisphaerales bacterium]
MGTGGIIKRFIGVAYLVMGSGFIAFFVLVPGLVGFSAQEYHPPYACQSLECAHGYLTSPDGQLYCSKYPPKDILDKSISPTIAKFRSVTGGAFGLIGVLFASSMLISGIIWMLGWKISIPYQTFLLRIAPLLVLLFWILAFFIKAIYPITPM